MTELFVTIFAVFAGQFLGPIGDGDDKRNRHVAVEVSVEPTTLKPGATGEIRIQFQPNDGIHVNAEPPTQLKFADGSAITLIGDPTVPTDSTTGYVDVTRPLTYTFGVDRDAPSGRINVNGTLVYYFCSDKEGWCLRWKADVALTLSVDR